MTPFRVIFIVFCCAILGGAGYLSSQGIWGATPGVTSVRGGSFGYVGGGGRVK